MEASPVAEVSSNADTETVMVNGSDTTQGQHDTSTLVTDDIPSSSSSLSPVMKNTWLNTSESPLSPAQAMSSTMPAAMTDTMDRLSALELITRPLRLLDLPVDILKDIVKEVTHTNDLTSLALCHSALHRLVIPHIYSRFDIVWPDSVTPTEPRTGVDALTYGLATLVMAEDVFGEGASQSPFEKDQEPCKKSAPDTIATSSNPTAISKHALDANVRRRRGNYYAHFTRKFSLGNGPPEWVQEYLISKEGGKMLGTLVALAVARMRNLETFVWDMPTGILRDVWIALSSLDDRNDGLPCRLERVAVRFHDNSPEPHALPLHHPSPPDSAHPALEHVEHPSFSVLPPLKTISVLDVDELQYLDELSLLVGRSQHKLRELRLGIARHLDRDWATVWEGDQLHQVDKDHPTAGSVTIGEKRLGGVLGVLTAWVSDMRRTYSLPQRPKRLRRRSNATIATAAATNNPLTPVTHVDPQATAALTAAVSDIHPPLVLPAMVAAVGTDSQLNEKVPSLGLHHPIDNPTQATQQSLPGPAHVEAAPQTNIITPAEEDDPRLSGKLSLEILELERVPLSIPVLQNVIDWSVLTSLTLLQCANHDHLWKTLRRLYSPVGSNSRQYATSDPSKSKQRAPKAPISPSDYKLKLTKIHTDTITPALVTFIKETLAPNTLEVVFLQESCSNNTIVSIDSIFRGVLRKHKGSLKKVLIDSSERGVEGQPIANSRSKRWMLTREILEFMTSGKMPHLRELGAALDYRDWVSEICSFSLGFLC